MVALEALGMRLREVMRDGGFGRRRTDEQLTPITVKDLLPWAEIERALQWSGTSRRPSRCTLSARVPRALLR